VFVLVVLLCCCLGFCVIFDVLHQSRLVGKIVS